MTPPMLDGGQGRDSGGGPRMNNETTDRGEHVAAGILAVLFILFFLFCP